MNPEGVVLAPLALEAIALRGGDHAFRVLRCGMGPSSARRAAERLRSDPAAVVAVGGLCGALDPDFEPGDLVVPDVLRVLDGPTREVDGAPLRRLLAGRGWRVHGGTLLGVDRIVSGSKRAAYRDRDARAIDMESAWLVAAAGARPCVVLRVVVDGPQFELFRPGGLVRGYRALIRLRQASAVLDAWAAQVTNESPSQQTA